MMKQLSSLGFAKNRNNFIDKLEHVLKKISIMMRQLVAVLLLFTNMSHLLAPAHLLCDIR